MRFIVFIICFLFSPFIFAQKGKVIGISKSINSEQLDSIQYSLGIITAKWIAENGFSISNPKYFLLGMDDAINGRGRRLNDSIVNQFIVKYKNSVLKEKGVKQEQQLFATLTDKKGVGVLPNGIRYIIQKQGIGQHALEQDSIYINILAKLPDNTIIENSYQQNQPVISTPNSFFNGLKESILMMPEGSKWQFFIPSNLAYGENGNKNVPPNSALIIEIELIKIKKN